MVEIYSKSLVSLIVKQQFWWSTSTTLDVKNYVLQTFSHFFSLYTLQHTSVGLSSCISIVVSFEKFDSYDRYAACCVPLRMGPNSPVIDPMSYHISVGIGRYLLVHGTEFSGQVLHMVLQDWLLQK